MANVVPVADRVERFDILCEKYEGTGACDGRKSICALQARTNSSQRILMMLDDEEHAQIGASVMLIEFGQLSPLNQESESRSFGLAVV